MSNGTVGHLIWPCEVYGHQPGEAAPMFWKDPNDCVIYHSKAKKTSGSDDIRPSSRHFSSRLGRSGFYTSSDPLPRSETRRNRSDNVGPEHSPRGSATDTRKRTQSSISRMISKLRAKLAEAV